MDSKKVKAELKKYWKGTSSLNDEKQLKSHFLHKQDGVDPDRDYFNYLDKKKDRNPLGERFDQEVLSRINNDKQSRKPKNIAIKYWYVAATLALVISVSIIFRNEFTKVNNADKIVEVDTFEDPEKAFQETKRALLMISSKLNHGSNYAIQFSKFDKSQNNLKKN